MYISLNSKYYLMFSNTIIVTPPPPPIHTHLIHQYTIVLFYAIALAVYVDLDQDFAGFFSLNGGRHEACLSYGFGIALAAFLVNTIATTIGIVAICYHRLCPKPYKYPVH